MKVMMLTNQSRSMAVFWRVLMQAMQDRGWDISCCIPDDGAELQEMGYHTIPYTLDRKGINPFRDIRTLHNLFTIFREHKPDLVFSTTIKPVIYGTLAASYAKVPHIFATITGLGYAFEADTPLKKVINRIGSFLYSLALRHATGVFFQNREDAKLFRMENILAQNANVLFARGTGVDISHFSPAPFPDQEQPTFLVMARLLEAKGLREYAAAATMLKQKYPHARFQLLGIPESGPGSIPLEEVSSWSPDVEYLGETRDVRPYLANAHVAVLPSWREGLPTALMEAMSMGRPLVATNVPGCREVIKPGFNGFLAESKNPAALGAAMENFLKHPDLVSTMGHAGRHMAEKEFDAKIVANGIIDDMTRSMNDKRL